INVYQTPFLAEYGRFTAGLVSVETRRGGEKWKWELNDPLPEFFIRSWHLRGLRDATPRFNFEGPLIAGKLYFSEGVDFEVRKTPVYTLPFPFNLKKQEGINSFAQLDWVVSDKHLVTATVHVAPQRLAYVNIDYFNPESTAPDASTHNYTGTLADRLTIFGGLLETVFSVTRFDASVWGQGPADLVLTPTGNLGNYFAQQNRQASRFAGGSNFSPKPIHHLGTHNLKFGADLTACLSISTASPATPGRSSPTTTPTRVIFPPDPTSSRTPSARSFATTSSSFRGPRPAISRPKAISGPSRSNSPSPAISNCASVIPRTMPMASSPSPPKAPTLPPIRAATSSPAPAMPATARWKPPTPT